MGVDAHSSLLRVDLGSDGRPVKVMAAFGALLLIKEGERASYFLSRRREEEGRLISIVSRMTFPCLRLCLRAADADLISRSYLLSAPPQPQPPTC